MNTCALLCSGSFLLCVSRCAVCLQVGVVDSPPRVFNSPYATAASMDYNPMLRMSEFKVCHGLFLPMVETNAHVVVLFNDIIWAALFLY